MTTIAVLSARDTSSADADIAIGAYLAAALGVAESYGRHRTLYEDLYGCTRYDPATHALTVRAHRFRAVMLSRQRGTAVHRALGDRSLPIFTSSDIWVFLTAVPAPDDDVDRLELDLFRSAATIVGAGTELALPTPGNDRREWLCGLPTGIELPSYIEVVTAVTGVRRG
ncbi:hypothetical protein ACW2Q0_21315 [Nocardia sp. R16R-3T]